ncbi:MAG: hypothetical protein DMG57_06090 [Acidobacteria bacterium]|nr:MAG: hypothetical protein DMG57_06090 [Acidobacteriota bacterium]
MSLFGSLFGHRIEPLHLAPEDQVSPHTETRCCDRLPAGCRISLVWQESSGSSHSARARVVDMNGTGALIKCNVAIAPGSYVYIQARELSLMGSAYVRHCTSDFLSYRIGLQFTGPLMVRF